MNRLLRCVWLSVAAACALAVAGVALAAPGALAATNNVCPPGGVSHTTFHGGLLVTGNNYCLLDHVTVHGGVTVTSGSDVDLENSSVTGGVSVRPGGEIEVGISLFSTGARSPSTVRGGIRLNQPVDWDIETAHIYGGVKINQLRIVPQVPFQQPTFCGNTVYGGMSVRGVSARQITFIGDPGEVLAGHLTCFRNRIHGSLSIQNSSTVVVEGNRVTGSVLLKASTVELNGNKIGGSLLCRTGTTILPGEAPDPSGNMVGGANTC
jgi:hypothetical protein